MVISGDEDPESAVKGVRLCADAARIAYERAGALDSLCMKIQEKTGHAVTPATNAEAIT